MKYGLNLDSYSEIHVWTKFVFTVKRFTCMNYLCAVRYRLNMQCVKGSNGSEYGYYIESAGSDCVMGYVQEAGIRKLTVTDSDLVYLL